MASPNPNQANFDFFLAQAENGKDSQAIFDLRNYWKHIIATDWLLEQTIDFWYDRNFHGKLDPTGNIIYLSETNLKEFKRTGPGASDIVFGADFVVDAFSDLQLHFMQARLGQKLSPDGIFNIIAPEAIKGWTSVHQAYNQYLISLYDSLVGNWFKQDGREKKVHDLTSFIKATMELMVTNNGAAFISLSGLISSNTFANFGSGLVVELGDGEHGTDQDKIRWLADPNFMFYKSAAENHGFMVDTNAPWRLVADINHSVMQGYMAGRDGAHYGVTAANLFDKYFYRSYQYDIENLQDFFVGAYNTYCRSYPSYNKVSACVEGDNIVTKTKLVNRGFIDPDEAYLLYPNEFWLELYYFIRLRELGAPQDSGRFNREVKKIIQVYRKFGLDIAKEYVNITIKKTPTPHLPGKVLPDETPKL